jgi:hypothetical protein
MSKRPAIRIRIHDASIGIWQERADDPTFKTEVFGRVIRHMRDRGWKIGQDKDVHRHYRILSPNHRMGERGNLRCAIRLSGRVVDVDFWSITAPQINRHGRQHDFDKMQRMHHIERLRVELEFIRIVRWIETIAPVTVDRSIDSDTSAVMRIAKSYAESWHSDKALGHPVCTYDYNRKSADGTLLEHGQTIWTRDHKGRVIRGTAFYNINNMWWVVSGGTLHNKGSHDLSTSAPADLRRKENQRLRRQRLEAELSSAVQQMNYLRAEVLKQIIFSKEPVFMIWAKDHNAYYRSTYSGYTTDRIAAGKYTRAEAEAECRRCPSDLEMVGPDGVHVSFAQAVAA